MTGWLPVAKTYRITFQERVFILHSWFGSAVIEQFKRLATGGVVNNLNSALVRKVEIPLAPLAKQERLVAELEDYQKDIEKHQKQITDIEKQIQKKVASIWGA